MTVYIEIKCDNEAFGDNPEIEIARILNKLAKNIEFGVREHNLIDSNGNVVGHFDIEP